MDWNARFHQRVRAITRINPGMKSQHAVILAAHYTRQEKEEADSQQARELGNSTASFLEKLGVGIFKGFESVGFEATIASALELAIEEDGGVDTGL